MILGVLWFTVANAAAVLASVRLLDGVRTGRSSVDFILFLLIRLGLISTAVLVAGAFHALTPSGLGITGALALCLLLYLGVHRNLRPPRWPEVGALLWICAFAIALRLLAQVWFFSPHLGDALAYHLPKIGEWVRAGGFTTEMGLHPHASFPAGFELIEMWWVVFLRHDVLIEMAGVEFLLLAFAAVYALGEFLSLSARWAFFAALLYVMVPGLHLTTTSCLNDGPVAALVLATAALVAWRVSPMLLVMAVGLGLGVKATYGFTLPGLALLWVLVRRGEEVHSPRLNRITFSLGGMGFIIGSFWYLRNLADFGSMFHPLGDSEVFNPAAVQLGPNFSSFIKNASDLANRRIYDDLGAYGANVDNISGWGPVAYACGLVSLLVGLRAHQKLRILAAAFGVSLGVTLLFVQNDPWNLKYVFFFPALLCLSAAQLAERQKNVLGVAGAALVFSFLGTCFSYDLQVKHVRVLARQSWKERSALAFTGDSLPTTRIGCFGGFAARSYLLYGPDFSRKVVYLRSTSVNRLLEEIARGEIRFLYAVPGKPGQRALLNECLERGFFRPIGGRFYEVRRR